MAKKLEKDEINPTDLSNNLITKGSDPIGPVSII
jgi:hypothetical protein